MSYLMIRPEDSDRVAQCKIATITTFVSVTILGPLADCLPDIDSRGHTLAAVTGFAVGLCIKRSWWT